MTIPQKTLNSHVKKFITNGKHPDCQNLLKPIGYDENQLNAGEALLDAWLEAREKVKQLKEAKKLATETERVAGRAAQLEATGLREAVRALWMDDESTLVMFDLVNYRRVPTRAAESANGHPGERASNDSTSMDGSTNGSTDGASNGTTNDSTNGSANGATNGSSNGSGTNTVSSTSTVSTWVSDYQLGTTERIARWRVLFAMVRKLDEDKQAKLAEFGWNADHVDEALGLVEKYAQADAVQQKKMRVVKVAQSNAKEAEYEVRRWYGQATRLARSAIKRRVPKEQQAYMRDLLGL
ncbi:MAG: hypothetical protein KDJ65_10065 [Anaerolineae bacterium]|nr:hypothetical protein [Anaerolineae bacterium]